MSANHTSATRTNACDSVPLARSAPGPGPGSGVSEALSAEMVQEAAAKVRARFPPDFAPAAAVVCGSGLSSIAKALTDSVHIAFADIPHFPTSTIAGHEGKLLLGRFHGKDVVLLQGRAHPYEGNRHWQSALYVWVLRELGVRVLILTNATGGLNQTYHVGQLVLIKDQLDLPTFAGANALYGLRDERLYEQRFVHMRCAYDLELRRLALSCARDLWGESALSLDGGPEGPGIVQVRDRADLIPFHSHPTTVDYDRQVLGSLMCSFRSDISCLQGVYTLRAGPTYETAAECRALRTLGGDVVGMSTAYETVVARAVGLRVLCVSVVTNLLDLSPEADATPLGATEVTRSPPPNPSAAVPPEAADMHLKEVLVEGQRAAARVSLLIGRILENL